ncbi:Protein png1 [Conoideocrella luteorostrata]|uniref:Protein png1 n=1 Tax=Conoideocrella luteorostrata TaxID=1105319 RepID=A0AAJ0D0X6_9HYPO|nr:Protein png1 [Conoideocrella luteorostrata]
MAGPVIPRNGSYYQLTVAHVFQRNNEPLQLQIYGAMEAGDCDFDGMSDDDGDKEGMDDEITRRGSATPEWIDSDKDSFTAKLDPPSSS